MEATIFVLSSLATNLAGIYRQVPFTVVDPHHTFLERLVGSVQVSCTIYTLRYWHPLVFPEAAKYESRCEGPCESPAQNTTIELGGMLKNLMDHQNSVDICWTVFFTALVLIAIILVLWKGFTQGGCKHDTDTTSGQKSNKSADLSSEKEVLNWIHIARFAVVLDIKDDISHDSVNIRAKIMEIPKNLRRFQSILQSDSMLAESKEGDDVERNKTTLADVFDGHLRFCTETVKDSYGHSQGDQKLIDPTNEFSLYQQELLTKDTLEVTTSAMEKRILGTVDDHTPALDEETKKRIGIESALANISALHEETKRRIDNIESALAKVQQSLSVGVVDQEQLNETVGGLKADMGNLRTSLQSLSREGSDSQVGVDTIVHEQLQSLENRVRSLERAASVTPLDKKQIEQELDELDQAVINMKNSHAEIQSKLDSTVTETQVKEALKQIAAHLEQETGGMKSQLCGLVEALDEVTHAAIQSKNNDPELAKQLEDIERAIDDSARKDEAQAAGFGVQSLKKTAQPTKDEAKSPKGEAQIKEQIQTSDDQHCASAQSEPINPRTSNSASQAISGPKQSPVAGRSDEAVKHDKADTAQSRAEHNQEDEKGHESASYETHKEAIAQPKASVGTQSLQVPGSVKGRSSEKHAPEPLRLKIETHTSARHEKDQASAQLPSKPSIESTSAKLSKSRWALSTPTQLQSKTPTHGETEEGQLITPTLTEPPSKPITESIFSGMSNSKWAPSTTTQAQPETLERTQSLQTSGSAEGKSSKKHTPRTPGLKQETSAFSAKREKSKGADTASAQSPSKSSTESASAEMSKSRWASTPTQTQSKTPTHGGTKGDQLASSASTPEVPSKPPASGELSKSRWADDSPDAKRSKGVSLPSEKYPKGDLGETF
ncbi:hypothetical protein LV164_003988 [Aspergillus fumigatus]|nr:hypothetical protein KXX42_008199 [Aspergillus fumigatus]KAH1984711.1 hypothetical protein KXW88_001828 [Aspergillus fumigatus]KAH2315756.1 hypothetical protein KXV47_001542 [Aspergillus fumigatus]KAH2768437.1 hypothetical protein KXV94_000764 [Aspergillus fumigatus]KAH3026377.1 hypothetical protein KXW60_008273 [Aspergillus fumigatus]